MTWIYRSSSWAPEGLLQQESHHSESPRLGPSLPPSQLCPLQKEEHTKVQKQTPHTPFQGSIQQPLQCVSLCHAKQGSSHQQPEQLFPRPPQTLPYLINSSVNSSFSRPVSIPAGFQVTPVTFHSTLWGYFQGIVTFIQIRPLKFSFFLNSLSSSSRLN